MENKLSYIGSINSITIAYISKLVVPVTLIFPITIPSSLFSVTLNKYANLSNCGGESLFEITIISTAVFDVELGVPWSVPITVRLYLVLGCISRGLLTVIIP